MFDKIVDKFKTLGKSPEGLSPTDAAAYELGVSRSLSTVADARKDRAKKAAIKLGIISNENRTPGTERVYTGDQYVIDAVTKAPRKMLNEQRLFNGMVAAGLSATDAAAVIVNGTTEAKAATSFEVSEV